MTKGLIELRTDICKACELCISVCPNHCLQINQTEVNAKGYHPIEFVRTDYCIGCANCAVICPDGVINVYMQ